jgi:tetratricopeptide (TPR) repeat protein
MWSIEAAEQAYQESIRADGNFPYGQVRLASLLALRYRYREARVMLTGLLATRPDYCPARIQLGQILGHLGHLEEAVSVLREATTNPEYEVSARLALVELYLQANLPVEAVSCAQIAASSRPDAQTYSALAGAFLAAGDMQKADSAAATAVEKDPLSADAHLALARVQRARGQLNDALRETRRGIELSPYSVEALELAGLLFQATGEFQKCAEFWQRALTLNPWQAELHRRLGDVLGPKLGDWSGAQRHLVEYVNLEKLRTEAAK